MSQKVFAYIDETQFKINDDKILGAGSFSSIKEIKNSLITEGLNALEKLCISDHSERKLLERTLNRGFFHATDDCHIARIAFAKTINKNLTGVFEVFFTSNDNLKSQYPEWNMSDQHRQQQMAVLATFAESVNFNRPIEVFIERAPKQIIKQTSFWENAWIEQLQSAINLPMSPHYFPKIETNIVDKNNPGTQVTDLLLWACQRKYSGKSDNGILELSGLNKRLSLPYRNTPVFYDSYFLKHEFNSRKSYHRNLNIQQLNINKNKIENLIIADQSAIDLITKLSQENPFPEKIIHFKNKILSAANKIKDSPDNLEHLQTIRELYIIIFDTLPIYPKYNEKNSNEIESLLRNKFSICASFNKF